MISADSAILQTTAVQTAIQPVTGAHPDVPVSAAPTPPINGHVQIWMAMMDASTKTAAAILDLQTAGIAVVPNA